MRSLFASTCLTPIALGLITAPTFAATVTISAAQTTPVATATADSGAPADISITSSGSITPASGTAVTIDSDNSVTNAGAITIDNADGAVGILANADVTGSITNSGSITIGEDYSRTDSNGDGVLDGDWAEGSDRYGIRTAGALTGSVSNSGTITVNGNDSAGVALDGALTGSLSQTGTIAVTGDNSYGVRAGAVSGDVELDGTITATGAGTSAVLLNDAIGGALVVQGTMISTGYSDTTAPTDTSTLIASDLQQSGPTMQIAGSIAGGALFTTASSTTDSSGNTVSTTTSSLTAYGSAPALLVGSSSNAITLGPVASDASGDGLVLDGTLSGNGVYDGITANALVIGGQGAAVTIANGMENAGAISATANDASATAVRVGSGASVPTIANSGTISATGATAAADTNAAVLIDAGADVTGIVNSGSITATTTSGDAAAAVAIRDEAGTVASVDNTGTIAASGSTADNVAIDLSANTSGATVTQSAASSGTTAPSITGDILFGGGSNTLTASAGSISGNVRFGAGSNVMALSGSTTFIGDTDFDGGASSLSIADTATYTGAIINGAATAVSVSGGTLNVTSTGATVLESLSVANGGTLGVAIDGTTGAATLYDVAGAASFGSGSKLALSFSDISHTVGTYTVLEAVSLSGADNLATSGVVLPYMYDSSIVQSGNAVEVSVARKTAAELGLNRADAAAYDPIYAAISADSPIGDSFLALTDGASFTKSLRELMPDYAGGAFETAALASRQSARMLADPDAPVQDAGEFAYWLQETVWSHDKQANAVADGYRVSGWGVSGGAEIKAGRFGRFGVSLGFMPGTDDAPGTQNSVTDNQYELAGYWRSDWGGLHMWARGSWATIDFSSRRRFEGSDDGTSVVRTSNGKWNGKLYSGAGGLSYRLQLGAFSLRPQGSIDYYRLKEGGYSETGGGVGMDLVVDGRTSDEFAANGALALGYSFYDQTADDGGYLKAELEGGRRQIINGTLGSTTAHFAGGQDFTLVPDQDDSGWTGAVRLKGGASHYTVSGEIDGERQDSRYSVAARVGVQIAL